MTKEQLKEELLIRVKEAKKIVAAECEIEKRLFNARFNGSVLGDIEHFDQWRVQYPKVVQAIAEWQAAVDAYVNAAKFQACEPRWRRLQLAKDFFRSLPGGKTTTLQDPKYLHFARTCGGRAQRRGSATVGRAAILKGSPPVPIS